MRAWVNRISRALARAIMPPPVAVRTSIFLNDDGAFRIRLDEQSR